MRRIPLVAAFVALSLAMVVMASEERRVLRVFTWDDYFDPGVVAAFEAAHDCTVQFDIFDSNQQLLRAVERNPAAHDILLPSAHMAAILRQRGLIRDIDLDAVPNAEHLDPEAAFMGGDPDMSYSVPYTRTVTGIGYDRTRVPESAVGSWKLFDDPAYQGGMALLGDMRECLGAALKLLGHSINTKNAAAIVAAGEVVRRWRAQVALFDVEDGKAGLVEGRFAAVQNYNGDMLQAMDANPDLGFFVPEEGAALTYDDFVVAARTREPDLAHAFINHMLDPEMARRNMETTYYYQPVPAALERLAPEVATHPAFSIPAPVADRCEIIRDVGHAAAIYERVWDAIRAEPRRPAPLPRKPATRP